MIAQPGSTTARGNTSAVAHTVAPKAAFRLLDLAHHVFPDSAAARGDTAAQESEQVVLARLFKGIHW